MRHLRAGGPLTAAALTALAVATAAACSTSPPGGAQGEAGERDQDRQGHPRLGVLGGLGGIECVASAVEHGIVMGDGGGQELPPL